MTPKTARAILSAIGAILALWIIATAQTTEIDQAKAQVARDSIQVKIARDHVDSAKAVIDSLLKQGN